MAWTTPKTFVAGAALTAAELNTYLRDNMMEMSVAKAASTRSIFTVQGKNRISQRTIGKTITLSSDFTNSTDYDDLDEHDGPTCQLITGESVLVFLKATAKNDKANISARMSFAVSGATEIEPSDNYALMIHSSVANVFQSFSCIIPVIGELTPGLNIFTCKYRAGRADNTTSNANFFNRKLTVLPLD